MKILHIETGRHLYGGALQVHYLIKGLRSLDCRNVLVCPQHSQIAESVQSYAKIYAVPIAGDLDVGLLWRLCRIIRKELPDIIHVHSRRGADIWGGLAALIARRPAIITRRVDNPEIPLLARMKYRLYKRVITISEGIKNVLVAQGVPETKTVCVHSAVDTELFYSGCDRNWLLQEFELPADSKTVGMVAQLIDRKGHRYLFKAVPEILKKVPETVFLLFGKGPLENNLRKKVTEQGLTKHIRFAGYRDDLHRIMPCLDLLVHPALMEGLGVSLLQAAACGVPIVASNVGGIPEIVHDCINGYLVEPARSEVLADKIIELLQDSSIADQLAVEGPKIINKYFSIEAMVNGNFKIYKKILNHLKV